MRPLLGEPADYHVGCVDGRFEIVRHRGRYWAPRGGGNFTYISDRLTAAAANWCLRYLPTLPPDEQRRYCGYPVPVKKRRPSNEAH